MADHSRPWIGDALILASAVTFSTAGLFTGLVGVDGWTMLFWRGLFGGLFIAGFLAWRHGAGAFAGLRASGGVGLATCACSAIGTVCFIQALRHTSVAHVTIIYATAPFLAAALARLAFGERQRARTLTASLVALAGVTVTVGLSPGGGAWLGDALALAMTALIAAMMVLIRRFRELPMLPAASLSGFACALMALPLATPLAVTGGELLWLAVFGTVQFGLGLLLLTLGSRRMPGSRAALLGNAELPLAPPWVWIALGQAPPAASWWGGAIVALALAVEMRGSRRPRRVLAGAG